MRSCPENKILPVSLLCFTIFTLFFANISYAKVILDPGHSPGKYGAMSCTGEKEHKYNDQLAAFVKTELDKNNIENSLTRNPVQDKSLIARTRNTENAKLFLSLHHDSVQPQFINYINGHPTSEKAEGYSLFVSRKNKYFDESLEYARNIAANLYNMGLRPSHHHGDKIRGENREVLDDKLGIYVFDDLIVLKNSQCPAVLLEAGVIVNPGDERKVKTDKFKSNLSKAIVRAIKNVSN